MLTLYCVHVVEYCKNNHIWQISIRADQIFKIDFLGEQYTVSSMN